MSVGLTILIIWIVRMILKYSIKDRDVTFIEWLIAIFTIVIEIILICRTWSMTW